MWKTKREFDDYNEPEEIGGVKRINAGREYNRNERLTRHLSAVVPARKRTI